MNTSAQVNPTTIRLGGLVDLDGKVSWAPTVPGHVQPINCYLVNKGERAVLVDTGVASHRNQILMQLESQLAERSHLIVCLTRSELECIGNVGAIHRARTINELVRGPVNPFDDFENMEDIQTVTAFPVGTFSDMTIGNPPFLKVLPPRIRVLTTFWFYDSDAKTLYSSDFFGHTSMLPGQSVVVRSLDEDMSDYETARAHLLAKYWWIPKARTRPLRRWLADVFDKHPIETIAPTHGRVLRGTAVVQKHLDLILRILAEEGIDS